MIENIEEIFRKTGFEHKFTQVRPSREAVYATYDDMGLSPRSLEFWRATGYPTMWNHQRKAIVSAKEGHNVCISTSTSSGKTEIFQTIALEELASHPKGKVLAIYSAKALNRQQRARWDKTGFKVGQIDGDSTNSQERCEKLKSCNVIVMTPDVLHAFLLAKVNDDKWGSIIRNFISKIELVIIDEIHLYKGVFGTNSAYLFRRLNNVRRLLRNDLSVPKYVTASATLPNPAKHSSRITGAESFVEIGMADDGSPIAETEFIYISPTFTDKELSLNQMVANLAVEISKQENARSITFVTGRQNTGEIAMKGERERFNNSSVDVLSGWDTSKTKIYPFRAGIEISARETILKAMEEKNFHGIISTSALEIGIDISGLNVCILANIPYDRNSYYQRIGRVGRGSSSNKSTVIIVNDGSLNANLLFNRYRFDIDRLLPDIEPSLHLEATRVMHAHAACHVHTSMAGCEISSVNNVDSHMERYFPKKFCELCRDIVSGNRTAEYDEYIARVDEPHRSLSLRNMDTPYQVVEDGQEVKGDTLTAIQLFREGYVRAVRYVHRNDSKNKTVHGYLQRVIGIDKPGKLVLTMKEKSNMHPKTRPFSRTFLNPNLSKSGFLKAVCYGKTGLLNLKVYENRIAYGYYETRGCGWNYSKYDTPFRTEVGTTGILFHNICLNAPGVDTSHIARLIFEAFLLQKAFDRNDINYIGGQFKTPSEIYGVEAGDKFVAIYDGNQLNITSCLLREGVLRDTFECLQVNIDNFSSTLFEAGITRATKQAALQIARDILEDKRKTLNVEQDDLCMQVLSTFSPALLVEDVPEKEEVKETPCMVVAVEKSGLESYKVIYTVYVEGERPRKVSMDYIQPVQESVFSRYNWEKGIVIQ